MNNPTYVLRGGNQGARRLKVLGRVMWPTTRRLLRQAGVRQGMNCLDVGCGSGEVVLRLARMVGPSGSVTGIDLDEAVLKSAVHRATRDRVRAMFQASSISQFESSDCFDLVYSRFLLSHLKEPRFAVQQMAQAVRPGGLLVVEDIDAAASFCHPSCSAYNAYVRLYCAAVVSRGADPTIGPRLFELMLAAGLEEVRLEIVQPVYNRGEGKQIAQITMEHIRESVVASGLATHAEVTGIVRELTTFAVAEHTLMALPRIFQVWGRKPLSAWKG